MVPLEADKFEGAAPPVLMCGQWDNYRTIFEDFMVLYLFGLRLIEA